MRNVEIIYMDLHLHEYHVAFSVFRGLDEEEEEEEQEEEEEEEEGNYLHGSAATRIPRCIFCF